MIPKDLAVLKILRRSSIHDHHSNSLFVEISSEFSPGKQGVSETFCSVLLPSQRLATTVVNYYDHSIFSLAGFLGMVQHDDCRRKLLESG